MNNDDLEYAMRRVPALFATAMDVAPLVRLGILTDKEGHELVDRRYRQRWLEAEDVE